MEFYGKGGNQYCSQKQNSGRTKEQKLSEIYDVPKHPLDESHSIYRYTGSDPHEIDKAEIKANILRGTYTLQANNPKFNTYEVDKNFAQKKLKTENIPSNGTRLFKKQDRSTNQNC